MSGFSSRNFCPLTTGLGNWTEPSIEKQISMSSRVLLCWYVFRCNTYIASRRFCIPYHAVANWKIGSEGSHRPRKHPRTFKRGTSGRVPRSCHGYPVEPDLHTGQSAPCHGTLFPPLCKIINRCNFPRESLLLADGTVGKVRCDGHPVGGMPYLA